ncbi:hypothetical protein SAP2_15260 [Staphylococcus arlettae]|nr:hypothetical protein SAP2_15260 [Staphylococcus arlettae]
MVCNRTSQLKGDYKDIDIKFKYNKVANTELQIQMAQSSMSILSHETVIENTNL